MERTQQRSNGETTLRDVQNLLYCMIGMLEDVECMDVHFKSSVKDNLAFAEFVIENCRMRIETKRLTPKKMEML